LSFPSITGALPLMQAGRLKALAVTSSRRAALLPDVPTVSEAALTGFDRSTWHGFLAPAGVPKDIIATLNALIVKIVNATEAREQLTRQGLEPQTNAPGEFAALIRKEIAQVTQLIRATGAKAE